MAPRTVYASLTDGLQPFSLWDQSLADVGNLGMIPCTAAGTNTIVLTPIASAFAPNISNPPQQLQNFTFAAVATSTGPVTINGLKLYKEDAATQASTGDTVLGVTYGVVYNSALNGAAGGYQIAFPVTSVINPVISGATISGSTITTSTYNGNTWTAGTGVLTIAALKTLTVSNSLTLAGTDGTVMTFPTTSATIARTDAANTFTGTQTVGALVATTVNGNTVTAGTGVLTLAAGKTLTASNTLTLAGTDSTTMTFPTTSATIARTDAGNTFTGTQNLASLTISSAVATDASKNLVSVTNTGSGNNVLATSPVLTTPTLGAATATTVAFSPTTGGIIGTAAADNASAGNVGEVITSTIAVGSAVALSTGVAKTVTSITLTAGDWDVFGNVYFTLGGTTTASLAQAGINTSTNTFPAAPDNTLGFVGWQVTAANAVTGSIQPLSIGTFRQSVSGSTTIFLVAFANFATSTCAAYGSVWARRRR